MNVSEPAVSQQSGADTVPARVTPKASASSRTGTVLGLLAALLAALALGPWLGLHPGLVSCLFLALTLLLLSRVARAAEGELGPTRAWWLLPVLVVLWANSDGWVVLGPTAIGLGALGERLRRQ